MEYELFLPTAWRIDWAMYVPMADGTWSHSNFFPSLKKDKDMGIV